MGSGSPVATEADYGRSARHDRSWDEFTVMVPAGETLPLVDQIDGATCRYTWVSDEAGLVWINGLFDARNLEQSSLHRVEGEAGLWALSLRLPSAWVGSYLLIGSQFLEALPQVTTEA